MSYEYFYFSLEDLDIWFEILDRAQRAVLYVGLFSRYAFTNVGVGLGDAFIELSKYDALNLYQRIKNYSTQKQVFMDLAGYGQMLSIIREADEIRFNIYAEYGIVTPMAPKLTYSLNYQPSRFTVQSQNFEKNTETLKKGKTNGLYDLAPCIFGPWVRRNFANG